MTESKPSIGDVVTIRVGDTLAEFTTTGAHIRRFQVGERDVIVPFDDALPWGAHGAVLAPWPNRVDAGTYEWEGHAYALEITEPERNTAIHGLVMTAPWRVRTGEGAAHFSTDLAPQQGYPFPLRFEISYRVSQSALTVDFRATNLGAHPAPFGVGFHPWLAAGPGGLEAATLEADVDTWLRTDDRLLPVAEERLPEKFDFRRPRPIGDLTLDDGFGAAPGDVSGRSWIRLTGSDGFTAAAWMRNPLEIWQLCTDPGPAPRPGVAAEPMTCPANAFNSGDRLRRLDPGAAFEAQWGLSLTPAA